MKCPNCGNTDKFFVGIRGRAVVDDGGAGYFRDFCDLEIDSEETCQCEGCDYAGDLEKFEAEDD